MRSIHDNMRSAVTIPVAAQVEANDGNGTGVDVRDADSVQFLVVIGTWTDGDHSITFEDSEDGTTYAPCEVADLDPLTTTGVLESDGLTVLIDDDTRADTVLQIGYVGGKGYVRAVNDAANDTDGAIYGVVVQQANRRFEGRNPMQLDSTGAVWS